MGVSREFEKLHALVHVGVVGILVPFDFTQAVFLLGAPLLRHLFEECRIDGTLNGIVSERDYARKVILAGRASKNTPVSDIMTRNLVTVTPEHTTQECLDVMTERRVRHLPVMANGKVDGMLSIGDLVKAIMAEQKLLIAQLQQYIAG